MKKFALGVAVVASLTLLSACSADDAGDAVETAASQSTDLLPGVQRRLRLRSRGRFYNETPARKRGASPWPLMIASFAVLAALVISYLLLGQVGTAPPAPAPSAPAPETPPAT